MKLAKSILIVLNLAALVLQFGLSIAQATQGPQVNKARLELATLLSENQWLKNQIAMQKNLENIETRAASLGLIKIRTAGIEPVLVASRQP